ncbi:hypothetical protein [Curtobacterium sp. NPDC088465]|uniref:hypothetical protein n=1 Tax=Curtobacterium sp. NPDC088465 TaxID=3363967 RepID=UPI0037F6E98E
MFEEDEWAEIAARLVRLTQAHRLSWELEDRQSGQTFVTDATRFTRYELAAKDNDNRFPFTLSVYQRDGANPDRPYDTFETIPFNPEDGSPSDWINDLFPLVRRNVTGAPKIAAALLRELDSLAESD